MRALQTWSVTLGIALISLAGPASAHASHRSAARPIFTVHVSDYAGVPTKELAEAERVATAIFSSAGVALNWVDSKDVAVAQKSDRGVLNRPNLTSIYVHIQASAMADSLGLSNEVMGLAPGSGPDRQLVYVFYDRVKDLAQRQLAAQLKGAILARAGQCQILGEMMAHEIGHVLLDMPSHSENGIMRGGWDLDDLQNVAYCDLLFTKMQAGAIRSEVVRRAELAHIVGQ